MSPTPYQGEKSGYLTAQATYYLSWNSSLRIRRTKYATGQVVAAEEIHGASVLWQMLLVRLSWPSQMNSGINAGCLITEKQEEIYSSSGSTHGGKNFHPNSTHELKIFNILFQSISNAIPVRFHNMCGRKTIVFASEYMKRHFTGSSFH